MIRDDRVLLKLEKVSLSYRGPSLWSRERKRVLDSVDLEIKSGETLGLVGRNGCGKSTLLRILAGIISPTDGRVFVAPKISRAVLALGLGFKPELSGRDNALLSSILQGHSKEEGSSYLEDIKRFSELGDDFELPVRTYSAGMRSRLGFSTALISNVDVLLIDEVLSVGDGHFREKAARAMREKILGDQTVVFVSHSANQVSKVCDRAVWLQDGIVKLYGEVDSVLTQYKASL